MATVLQTPTVEQLAWRAAQEARERNERAYRVTVDVQDLPSGHVAYEATESAVLVTATNLDVLGEWLYVRSGTVSKVDLPHGQTVWTLRTSTFSDSPEKFPPVPVFVTVVAASHAPVMCEIREAVKAA